MQSGNSNIFALELLCVASFSGPLCVVNMTNLRFSRNSLVTNTFSRLEVQVQFEWAETHAYLQKNSPLSSNLLWLFMKKRRKRKTDSFLRSSGKRFKPFKILVISCLTTWDSTHLARLKCSLCLGDSERKTQNSTDFTRAWSALRKATSYSCVHLLLWNLIVIWCSAVTAAEPSSRLWGVLWREHMQREETHSEFNVIQRSLITPARNSRHFTPALKCCSVKAWNILSRHVLNIDSFRCGVR